MYNKKYVFWSACLGMLLFGIVLITLGSIMPQIAYKFKVTTLEQGSILALLPFGILLGSIVFGPLVDKNGYKILMVVCSFLIMISMQLIAMANSLFLLNIAIFIIGFSGGAINGGTNALVADISEDEKGAKLNLLGVFFGIGALGLPAILGAFPNASYDTILSIIAAFIIITILIFVKVKFPEPKHKQGFPVKYASEVLKNPFLILFSFCLFFQSSIEGLLNNWTTTYLTYKFSINSQDTLYPLSLFVAGLAGTRLIISFLKIKPQSILYASLLIALIGLLLLMSSTSITIATIALIILGAGTAASFPTVLGFVGTLFSNLTGTAFSVALVISLIGNMLFNYMCGVITNQYGVLVFPYIVLFCLVCFSIILFITLSKYKNKEI